MPGPKGFHLGKNRVTGEAVYIPQKIFKRHFSALGASGSGKTVLCKVLMEEAVRKKIPTIMVDPQGDIASLALLNTPEELQKHNVSTDALREYQNQVSVRIFTPASSKGIPISIQPLKFPDSELPQEELIRSIDFMASTLIRFLGYDEETDAGKAAMSLLFHVFNYTLKKKKTIDTFTSLAEMINTPPQEVEESVAELISEKEKGVLAKKIRYLTVGTNSLIFNYGVPLDIDAFLKPDPSGKTPMNIIYLNTLNTEEDKLLVVAILAREIYNWMIKNPSEKLQLLFYIDEIAPYLPPHPYTPPPKTILKQIFKQARKYGVGLVVATQNPTDIDYKALAQVSSWSLGRMMTKQDIDRVKHILRSISPNNVDSVTASLPKLKSGEFLLLSPDVFDSVIPVNTRWLVTQHKTLDEDMLTGLMPPELFDYFISLSKSRAAIRESRRFTSRDKILNYLSSDIQTYTTEQISKNIDQSTPTTEKMLQKLVNSGKVRKEIIDGTPVFWYYEFKLKPLEGINSALKVAQLNVPLSLAHDNASRFHGGVFGAIGIKRKALKSELHYLPVWKIVAKYRKRSIIPSKRMEERSFWVNGLTNKFLRIHDTLLSPAFLVQTNSADKELLSGEPIDNRIVFNEILSEDFPRDYHEPIISKTEAEQIVKETWAADVQSTFLYLFPVWEIQLKKGKKILDVYVDGVIGFPYIKSPLSGKRTKQKNI